MPGRRLPNTDAWSRTTAGREDAVVVAVDDLRPEFIADEPMAPDAPVDFIADEPMGMEPDVPVDLTEAAEAEVEVEVFEP